MAEEPQPRAQDTQGEDALAEPTPEAPQPRGGRESLQSASSALGEAVGTVLRVLARRGRVEAERLASRGRVRLDLRQLRKDRDVMYQKLGKEVRALVEGGEIDHPGLARGVERIEELELRIEEVEGRLSSLHQPEAVEEE